MKKVLFLILITILFNGCGAKLPPAGIDTMITDGQRIYTQSGSISVSAPSSKKYPFEGFTRFRDDFIIFERTSHGLRESIRMDVTDITERKQPIPYFLLDKEKVDTLEQRLAENKHSEWSLKNYRERGKKYYKYYVDYISNLKCATHVEGAHNSEYIGSKDYQTYCVYYDKNSRKKKLWVNYTFYLDYEQLRKNNMTPYEAQLKFKEDVKEIINSIIIHEIDIKRMKSEGLWFDRVYEVQGY